MSDSRIDSMEEKLASLETSSPEPNGSTGESPKTITEPALVGVFFSDEVWAQTTVGAAQLSPDEARAVRKIALKAFKRSIHDVISKMSVGTKRRGRPKASKTAKLASAPSPAPEASGIKKRRGRPPKAKVITYEAPAVSPTPAE